jgi:hypothetical protein
MLHPKIVEVSTDKATGGTFVLARFWKTKAARTRGDKPYLTNDFVLAVDAAVGPAEEIQSQVHAYAARAEKLGYAGDHSSANAATTDAFSINGQEQRRKGARVVEPRLRDESDPHGVLAKPEVAALPGKDIDLEMAQ